MRKVRQFLKNLFFGTPLKNLGIMACFRRIKKGFF